MSNTTAKLDAQSATARFNMIEQQIRTWEVLDPKVLTLLNDLPRENFVPTEYKGLAFADVEIPLGCGQTMLSPKLEGRILQALNVEKTHTVLHIGTGSGYFTGLLASLAKQVVSVEVEAELSAIAAKNLADHHLSNVVFKVTDANTGRLTTVAGKKVLYDTIVYTASSPVEPAGMREQLNVGGVMFIVLGVAPVMRATLIKRVAETGFREDVLFETCIPALTNAPQAEQFEF